MTAWGLHGEEGLMVKKESEEFKKASSFSDRSDSKNNDCGSYTGGYRTFLSG